MLKNKAGILWCIAAAGLYNFYIVTKYRPLTIISSLYGVKFNGDTLFYASTIFLFAMFLLFSMSDVEKYVNGVGILEMTRYGKRSIMSKKIFFRMIEKILSVFAINILILIMIILFTNSKVKIINSWEIVTYVITFIIVIINLQVSQFIMELLLDERMATFLILGIVILQLYIGDVMYSSNITKGYIVVYSNYSLVGRSKILHNDLIAINIILILWVIVKMVIFNKILQKKDIFLIEK